MTAEEKKRFSLCIPPTPGVLIAYRGEKPFVFAARNLQSASLRETTYDGKSHDKPVFYAYGRTETLADARKAAAVAPAILRPLVYKVVRRESIAQQVKNSF